MNLRDLRDAMGLSISQVAEELGVPRQDVEDCEETGSTWLLQPFITAFPINPAIISDPDADPFLESYVQNEMSHRAAEWREENGVTLAQMAQAVGMTAEQLEAAEKSGKITRALGIKIEKATGMNRKWLMYGDGRKKGVSIIRPPKTDGRRKQNPDGEGPETAQAGRVAPNREAGLRMKMARKEAGLSREEVAEKLGVSVSRVAQMESGYVRDEKADEVIRVMEPPRSGKEIGTMLREARKAAGLKLKEAAEIAGLASGTLAAMECGHISETRAKELIEMFQRAETPRDEGDALSKDAGARIREERKAAGLSQKALGVILRVPESAVARMELGQVTEKRAEEIIRRIHGEPRHAGQGTNRKIKKTVQVLLGRQIRDAREAAGLSQKALGDLVGVPQSRISLIERGNVDEATTADILKAIEEEMARREAEAEAAAEATNAGNGAAETAADGTAEESAAGEAAEAASDGETETEA
ncbi:MAG: helix-turn-helix domain-containing protein [Clostridia bacterium]|nr:helix-turn-helix domain-containing protein [Clostridia bacterium]